MELYVQQRSSLMDMVNWILKVSIESCGSPYLKVGPFIKTAKKTAKSKINPFSINLYQVNKMH